MTKTLCLTSRNLIFAVYLALTWLAQLPVTHVAIQLAANSITKKWTVLHVRNTFLGAVLKEYEMLLAENIMSTIIGDARRAPPLDDILIRPAHQSELLSVSSLWVNVFYPDLITNGAFHVKVLEKLRTRRENGSILLVAVENEMSSSSRPAGFRQPFLLGTVEFSPSIFFNTTMESVGSTKKLYVMDLAIRKSARRMGLASRLLDFIEDYARDEKYKELYMHVEKSNIPALSLYQKRGFAIIESSLITEEFTKSQLPNPPEVYDLLWKQIF